MRRRFNGFSSNGSKGHANGHSAILEQADPRAAIAELSSVRPIDGFDGERWYPIEDTRGRLFDCLSVTTALSTYPKGRWFDEWMKKEGSNADKIRDDAARVGVATDRGTQLLDKGITLQRKEYSHEVYKALISYAAWQAQHKPEVLAQQVTVWNIDDLVAGTLDKIAEIEGELHLLEVKKTSGIRRTHVIQAQTYAHLCNLMGIPIKHADVLRLGTKHKAGYEFHSEPYDPAVYEGPFLWCRNLWKDMNGRYEPLPREELPESISLPVSQNGDALPGRPANGRTPWHRRSRR